MTTKKQHNGNHRSYGYQPHLHYDTALEQAVLATCISTPAAFGSVYSLLNEDCFFNEVHAQVYRHLNDMWQQGQVIDMLMLVQHLYTQGVAELGGTASHNTILSLCDDMGSGTHLQAHCLQLRELSARRALVAITSSGMPHHDVLEAAHMLQQSISQAIDVRTATGWQSAANTAIDLGHAMDDAAKGSDNAISTTISYLDDTNGGLLGGQLVVIGARPSVGKSALAGAIALKAAQQGRQVGYISLEMPARDVLARMVSAHSAVPLMLLRRPQLHDKNMIARIQQSVDHVSALPIAFADAMQATVHDIRARAMRLHQTTGLHLLVVDYLQLIEEPVNGSRSREQAIAQISRGLKTLAMELDIPVLALSQLNRSSEHRQNKRPTLADLRESGAIEQDADIVLLLHRDERAGILADAQGNPTHNQAQLMVAKWRNGRCCDIDLRFNGACVRFEEA